MKDPHAVAPQSERSDDTVAGHWLLARLGKRVLRPGGAELTNVMLSHCDLADVDVVELAPGLGRTAAQIVASGPKSYVGVERDGDAANTVGPIVDRYGYVRVADAADTGLSDESADVIIGEAMLTMQGQASKDAIVAEAVRMLRPGGTYAIHELCLTPDTVPESAQTAIAQGLARTIRVNARPLTVADWQQLLISHGLDIVFVNTAPMALLQPKRLVADEGLAGALRFAVNLLLNPSARRRVFGMARTFHENRKHLGAVALIASKPL